jgi:putative ABC transport system permease protein
VRSAFFSKMRGDLKSMSGRLVLLGLAVGIGVFVLAGIAGSASTLIREMQRSYEDTAPATATLELKGSVDPSWASSLAPAMGMLDARAGGSYQVRFLDGNDQWQPMILFIVPDLQNNKIARVFPKAETQWPPRVGNLALERTAFSTFNLKPDRAIHIRLANGSEHVCLPESVVHDPGVAPAYQERTAYAYIEAATARAWGLEPFNQVKVRFDQSMTWDEARRRALELSSDLGKQGFNVLDVQVPPVHRHPHQGILMTLLVILGAFGLLTILLCSLLVSNTVSAFIAKEKRWIGVMKTLGAPPGRITALTLAPVLLLGLGAVIWSVPLGLFVSKSVSSTIADLLNFSLRDASVQWWAWGVPVAAGLLAPLLIALFPAREAQRITILAALSDAGTEGERFPDKPGRWARFLVRSNPTIALAWRNIMRKKRRFALSLLLLGVGGGLFMTAFDLSASWKSLLAESFASRNMDYQIRLIGAPSDDALTRLRTTTPEIRKIEVWNSISVATTGDGGVPLESTYPDEAHGSFRAFGIAGGTSMVAFPQIAGQWSTKGEDAVLNQSAALRFPRIAIGDPFTLIAAGVPRTFRLAGIARELGQAAVYVDASQLAELAELAESAGYRNELLIGLDASMDKAAARKSIEAWLDRERIPVEVLIDNREFVLAGGEHFGLLIGIILALGAVTGCVGWIGIASILSLAVTERKREFGIMRTIGATPRSLLFGIMSEAALMTVLGSLTAVILSIPIALGLGAFLGNLSARMPLPLVVNLPMSLLWLAVSLPAGILASLGAGRRAATISIRETLNYL